MEKCSSSLAVLENTLADTRLYSDDRKSELMQLLEEQASLTQKLEEEEMAWLDAQEQIEKEREEYDNA